MSSIQIIHRETDRNAGWKPADNFRFAAAQQFVSVVLQELPQLLAVFPLGLIKDDAGKIELVAITGRQPGRNVFVAPNGQWSAPYIPLTLRLHPFVKVPSSEDRAQFSLAFKHDSGQYVAAAQGAERVTRFFNDAGEPSEGMQAVVASFRAHAQAELMTQQAVQALEQHDLLERWPGDQPAEDAASPRGLYRVNEQKLNALGAEALKSLQQANALALAYGQLLSMARMEVLNRLAAMHQPSAKSAPAMAPAEAAAKAQEILSSNTTLQFN